MSRQAELQRSRRGAGPVYLSSSSGATCSTKIRGLGGVLRGKELEHLDGAGGREEQHPRVGTPGEVVSE